jgi:hypothetical protein
LTADDFPTPVCPQIKMLGTFCAGFITGFSSLSADKRILSVCRPLYPFPGHYVPLKQPSLPIIA